MNKQGIVLLIVVITVLLGILVNPVAGLIVLPWSEPVAFVVLSIIALVSINVVCLQSDLQDSAPNDPSLRRRVMRFILAGGVTVIMGSLLSVIISQKNQLSNERKELAEQRKELTKEQTEFKKQRDLQLSQLRIGLLPDGARDDPAKENIIRSHLSDKLNNIDVTIRIIGPQYVDTMKAVVKGEIEVAYFGPLIYLHTIKSHGEIKPILFIPPDNPEANSYYSYIITRSDSGITSLEDVKGKAFIFGDEWSTSGTLYPKYFLKNAGIDVKGTYDSSHDHIVERVLESRDILIGAVSSFAYENYKSNLKVGEENRIIILNKDEAEANPIPPGPIVLRAGLQEYDILRIKEAYLSINDPFILSTLTIGKFTSLTPEEATGAYKSVADIASSLGLIL